MGVTPGQTCQSFASSPVHPFANTGFSQTATSAFFQEGSLLGNIDSLTPEQLRERLIVSETLMKKLYNRNKDIELYHKQKLQSSESPAKPE